MSSTSRTSRRWTTFLVVPLLCAVSGIPRAAAQDSGEGEGGWPGMDFLAKAAVGNKSSELTIRDRRFTPGFVTLDLALTAAIGRYFVTLDNEISIKDAVASESGGLIFYSRRDFNLTGGYSFDDYAVFGGWRTGETNAHYTGKNNSFGTNSGGVYLGGSASHAFSRVGGRLYGSVALARLTGKVSLTEPFVDTSAFALGDAPSNIRGSSIGVSAAVGWSGKFAEGTNWSIEYKLNRFGFKDDEKFGGLNLSYDENFQTLYLGLTHSF